MNPNVIQFACGHCQSWLTVPAHMAGVAGPCPKCGQHIVSPSAQPPPQAAFEPVSPPPVAQGNWPPAEPVQPVASASQPPAWPGAGLNQPQGSVPQAPPVGSAGQLPRPVVTPQGAFPQAPAAPPLVPPPGGMPWGQPPGVVQTIQDNGLPGGYPMYSQGLRPNAGLAGHGAALPPPAAPANPIAGLMGQMPMGTGVPDGQGHPGVLTRPATIGGSRLSLLARQLTTTPEGGQGLPVAPAPLSTAELPGQAPMAFAAPDGTRKQQAGDLMLKQSMRRGLPVSHTRSQGKAKFALAAILLLGLLAALVWQYRAPLEDIVVQVFPPKPAMPETSPPPPIGPVPGVDRVVKAPSVEPETAPHRPVDAPVQVPGGSHSEGTQAAASGGAQEIKDMRGSTGPDSGEPKGGGAVPSQEQVQKATPPPQSNPPPSEATKSSLQLMATINAPRATLAEDAADTAAPPVPPAPRNPLSDGQQKMVEVGRSTVDSQAAQSTTPPPVAALAPGQPAVKNVPPGCKPALDGLLSFLNARNWRERQKYVQLPEQMEPKLKLYYASNPDGPIDVDEIQYLRHEEIPQVGTGLHAVFVLFSRNWDYAFPVMVEVNADGARVDWLTFIECKDDMLNKFLSNYMEERVQFHVGIHRTHYFDDNIPGLDQKDQFSVTSPMDNVRGFVFVPKGTPFARSLASTISWDKEASFVVVELQWRKEGSAKWVEMTALPQLNWYSSAATPPPSPSSVRPPPAPPGSVAR